MSNSTLLFTLSAAILGSVVVASYRRRVRGERLRLETLMLGNPQQQRTLTGDSEIDWVKSAEALKAINDRLGRAGFYTSTERKRITRLRNLILLVGCAAGSIIGMSSSVLGIVVGGGAGLYLGMLLWLLVL